MHHGTLFNKLTPVVAHANDVVVAGRSQQTIKEVVLVLDMEGKWMGFQINEEKTKKSQNLLGERRRS